MTRYIFCYLLLGFFTGTKAYSQTTILYYQGGNPGDSWGYASAGASSAAISQTTTFQNYASASPSIVVGGTTGGGGCFGGGSGSGAGTMIVHTFTFDAVDISSSALFTRTLEFNWGNRQPLCSGSGWDAGENMFFVPVYDGNPQTPIQLATGGSDAQFSIKTNKYTFSIPPCVTTFSFIVRVNTNRADEILLLDDVTLTTQNFNPPLPQPSPITGNTTVCAGTTQVYSVTQEAGTNYTWSGLPAGASFSSPNGTVSSNTISVNWGSAGPGTYTLSVVPSGTCGTSGPARTITVNVLGLPSVTISGPASTCSGQNVALTSNNTTGNLWSTGATTQSITVNQAGTYSVDVSNSCGTSSASHTLTVNTVAQATITPSGPAEICAGQTLTLTSNISVGNSWSFDNSTTQSITISSPGTYTLTTTQTCGISGASITIAAGALPNAQITASGSTAVCPGSSVTLTASGGTSYLWSGSQTSASISAGVGTYTVTASNQCGQDVSDPVTISELPPLNPQIAGNASFCAGQQTTLTASGGNTYQWSTDQTTNPITVTQPGNYTVTAFNACGQSASSSLTVTVLPLPNPQITGNASFCQGQQTTLTVAGGDTYVWSDNQAGQSISVTQPGNYTVTASNGCGQVTSAVFTVSQLSLPNPQITGNASFCQGQQTTLSASGGTTHEWSDNQTGSSISVSQPGSYTVIATNSCGQTTSAPFAVTALPLPNPQITGSSTFCEGQQTTLTATGGDSYVWSDSQAGSSISVSQAGTFTVTATNSCGQAVSAPFIVSLQPLPIASISGDVTFCEGGQTILAVGGGDSYLWSTGSGSPSITVTSGGTYSVTVTNSCGSDTEDTVVTMLSVAADFTANPVTGDAPLDVDFINTSSPNAANHSWSFGDGNISSEFSPSHTYMASGNYEVTLIVTSGEGCISSHSSYVTVSNMPSALSVPNVFTPNGDGINDLFLIQVAHVSDYRLLIHNRCGNLVAEFTDPSAGWNGEFNGEAAETGTYFYQVTGTGSDFKSYNETGFFVLQR